MKRPCITRGYTPLAASHSTHNTKLWLTFRPTTYNRKLSACLLAFDAIQTTKWLCKSQCIIKGYTTQSPPPISFTAPPYIIKIPSGSSFFVPISFQQFRRCRTRLFQQFKPALMKFPPRIACYHHLFSFIPSRGAPVAIRVSLGYAREAISGSRT